ncbi:response regulator [bacterium (Candidatus Blackallbacteria) CG17_big_fil_post_rev_8_21_14_2_50_48_46]|uniref:Response regulator n=1 Tax=bacterium (Candidatus Blackallbacteria) CG17_big_fil_post_rev_8_21_14_2_50_48_46 TaxID=2014261 RepID=A0A2M7G5A7_9BACT|nr:MAG: response regulator [bacterium (Candidatus Blackallbacteria) CG18_big_fil_WC_8_21_14_2_50_49_26]PIW17078.1 MAG: response regulator [bacterium (Candidatus Blackallbacteria) CG17_big_fil_post_rev_8_21_14_2_50_48_46]PIW47687.1 MAG: response regulator [bacterium (Candidatus Blackallbacteria) CG13_big_fil_rev_8_21_14_2_50_49_14]
MHILIAEDDPVSLRTTSNMLRRWGYRVSEAKDGQEAWQMLEEDPAPLVIFDWLMPAPDGLELCRRMRLSETHKSTYILLLTGMEGTQNLIQGLEAGADDYLFKPVDPGQLKARLNVGERILNLQQTLLQRLNELEEALANVKELRGLLPICAYCKKIRNDENYWEKLEHYVSHHTHARFSHGICPDCYEGVLSREIQAMRKENSQETP